MVSEQIVEEFYKSIRSLSKKQYIVYVFRIYNKVSRTTADVRLHNRCCASVAQLLCGCRSSVMRFVICSYRNRLPIWKTIADTTHANKVV